MCGRFEQSETREYYARSLGVDTRRAEWVGGDTIPQYNVSPGRWPLVLHLLKGTLHSDYVSWGYRTPEETAEKKKPWINARIEKALNGPIFVTCSGKAG
jgi:putative SOS response-associated peptidase YedK